MTNGGTTKSARMQERVKRIEAMHRAAGLAIEMFAGQAGIVVYGPSRAVVTEAAESLLRTAQKIEPGASIVDYGHDADEPAETAFAMLVAIDWSAARMAA